LESRIATFFCKMRAQIAISFILGISSQLYARMGGMAAGITNFKAFGPFHLSVIFISLLIGLSFLIIGTKVKSPNGRKNMRLTLATVIFLTRGIRYLMDIWFGVFDLSDLLSLHVCHIDLIVLLICLIKPSEILFSFTFLVGIPMGLAVALFPGSNHPAPGLPRAALFIMSHMMLIMGALYLAIVERMPLSWKRLRQLIALTATGMGVIYGINKVVGTNFLYIMTAPKGSVIVLLNRLFGWPGYVFVMFGILVALMLIMKLGYDFVSGARMTHG
jgi:hypothetical integral membrane protein (TIGR02206 family)